MLTLRLLRTFQIVAQTGSFAAAADRAALTQAAVSLQMRALEEALGRQLFDRRARQIALTNDGRETAARVARILEQVDALTAASDDALDGSVSIGAVVSVIGALSLAVARLKAQHPGLEVQLSSARSKELEHLVHAGEVDFAIVIDGADGERPASLTWTPLYDEPLMLVVSSAIRETEAREILRTRACLRFDRRVPTGMVIDHALHALGIVTQDHLELNSIETIVALVRDDVGVSVLPVLRNANWREDPRLKLIPLGDEPFMRHVGMIGARSQRRVRLMQAIIEALRSPPSA